MATIQASPAAASPASRQTLGPIPRDRHLFVDLAFLSALALLAAAAFLGRDRIGMLLPPDPGRTPLPFLLTGALAGGAIVALAHLGLSSRRRPAPRVESAPGSDCTVRDISECQRAEGLLRQYQQRYRLLIESASDIISTVSTEGILTSLNPAFENILGWPRNDWIGKHVLDLIHPEDVPAAESVLKAALRGERPPVHDIRIRTRSGEWRVLESIRRPLIDAGKLLGVLSISRDVTERRQAEDARRHAQEELEERVQVRTREMNEANGKLLQEVEERRRVAAELARRTRDLERSNAELEQFAYVASHDLQEPLRMVTSYVQLLQERYQGRLDADADEFIGYAVEGARRMRRLILNLLEYSRRGFGTQSIQPVGVGDALNEALQNLRPRLEEAGATVASRDLPVVMADPTQLTEILQNLVSNAVKYRGKDPPLIEVSALQSGGECMIEVRDSGIGIDPKLLRRIFLPFQRGSSSDSCDGSGVGLAICKKIVERHGGRIWVESAPGRGSAFRFTLPACAEAQTAAAGKEA